MAKRRISLDITTPDERGEFCSRSAYYRDGQEIETGGGTGTLVTNHSFMHTAKHNKEFIFCHCRYKNVRGTALSWSYPYDVNVIVSDNFLDSKDLNKYTDEQCIELVLKHISAKAMLELISRIKREACADAVRSFKHQLREMIGAD